MVYIRVVLYILLKDFLHLSLVFARLWLSLSCGPFFFVVTHSKGNNIERWTSVTLHLVDFEPNFGDQSDRASRCPVLNRCLRFLTLLFRLFILSVSSPRSSDIYSIRLIELNTIVLLLRFFRSIRLLVSPGSQTSISISSISRRFRFLQVHEVFQYCCKFQKFYIANFTGPVCVLTICTLLCPFTSSIGFLFR